MDSEDYLHIPEESIWVANIRQLEEDDLALGYNRVTGADGPANYQAYDIGCRTLYLKRLFESVHDEEGRHHLRDSDFVQLAAINQTQICFDRDPVAIADSIESLILDMRGVLEGLDSQDLSGNIMIGWAIRRILPLSWACNGAAYVFEKFTPSLTTGTPKSYVVLDSRTEDDSFDIASYDDDGIELPLDVKAGEQYYFTNPGYPEFQVVTVKSIPDEAGAPNRIRVAETASVPFRTGVLSTCTGEVNAYAMNAVSVSSSFGYTSGWISGLSDCSNIRASVRHSADAGTYTGRLEIMRFDDGDDPQWVDASVYGPVDHLDDGKTRTDIYTLPDAPGMFRYRITYDGIEPGTIFHSINLASEPKNRYIDAVLRPYVASVTVDGDKIKVVGSPFASLYGLGHARTHIEASVSSDFHDGECKHAYYYSADPQSEMLCDAPDSLIFYVRINYSDEEGAISRYSDPLMVRRA